MRAWTLPLLLAACAPEGPANSVILLASPDEAAAVSDFARTIGDVRVGASQDPDPAAAGARDRALTIALAQGEGLCDQCYVLDVDGTKVTVRGGGRLGRLYGASHVLEAIGYRFHHPHHTFAPAALELDPEALPGPEQVQQPEVARRRGVHLHTLHPLDTMFDAWVPSEEGAARMGAVADWVVRNRGNHLQWVALDDIEESATTHAAWKAHTATLLDRAHEVGLTVGLGIQLFGSGNLQLAFDLVDTGTTIDEQRAELGPRLDRVTEGLDFDLYNLSFGEFFGADPERFIASVELVYDELKARAPEAELATVLHVGDDLRVSYDDKDLIYYFLATYADRPITHWAHTVMYYDLFGDAGGAYHHDAFDDHRAYLEAQLEAQGPVGYFPESAYWIAFDNSVPRYLPLYQRQRWEDLSKLAAFTADKGVPGLQDHVTFSSGWEWGHWQHDVATLRHSWKLEADWCAPLRFQLGAHGDAGAEVADAACALGDLQRTALIDQRLTPYLASYDSIMQVGFPLDIVAQPKRPFFKEVAFTTASAQLEVYRTDVANLGAYADAATKLWRQVSGLELPEDDTVLNETRQGLQLTALRARFAHQLATAAVLVADKQLGPAGEALDRADQRLAEARAVIDARHADLFDPEPERLVEAADNPTLYDYGYLLRADQLCYWTRELRQARNDLQGTTFEVPGCALEP